MIMCKYYHPIMFLRGVRCCLDLLVRLQSLRAAVSVVQAFVACEFSIFASDTSLIISARLYRLLAAPPGSMAKPRHGDRILVLKPHWLEQILALKKTLEIRGSKLKPGRYFLGSGGKIYASAILDAPIAIENVTQWIALREDHKVKTDALPYRKTYGLPIKKLSQLKETVPYIHPRGAIGIVRYNDSSRSPY